MPDVQILATQTAASPLDYTIPGSQEILIKSLFASFDGSGSASSFIPAVQVIAPGGHVAGTYLQNGQVSAGGSADASWFPGMNGAGANGIQYDTLNKGDWLSITTTGVQTQGFIDHGGLEIDVNGAASDMYVNVGRDVNEQPGNDYNLLTGRNVNLTSGAQTVIEATTDLNMTGDGSVLLRSLGGSTVLANGTVFIVSTQGGTAETIQIQTEDGCAASFASVGFGTEFLRIGSGGIFAFHLPTVNPGVSKQLWNNAGVVSIVP